MGMPTLIVEDGTGVVNSNTYISLADATTYFTNKGDQSWAATTADSQAAALFRAGQGLDFYLSGRWYGRKISQSQSMAWPRCGVIDSDGYEFPSNIVPKLISLAQAEIAKIELSTPFIQQKVDSSNSLSKQIIGPITLAFKESSPAIAYWPQIIAMLRDFALIGVVPMEVTIGISDRERRGMRRDRDGIFGGSLNPFDFPRYFELIKDDTYGSDTGQFGE